MARKASVRKVAFESPERGEGVSCQIPAEGTASAKASGHESSGNRRQNPVAGAEREEVRSV